LWASLAVESAGGFLEGMLIGGLLWRFGVGELARPGSGYGGWAWTAATAVGWGLGVRAIDLVFHGLRQLVVGGDGPVWDAPALPWLWLVSVPTGAAVLGLCQWVVLRRWVDRAAWWIPGLALCGVVAAVASVFLDPFRLFVEGWPATPFPGFLPRDWPGGSPPTLGWLVMISLLSWFGHLVAGVAAFAASIAFAANALLARKPDGGASGWAVRFDRRDEAARRKEDDG
jgi:hypothetical protein